MKYGFIGCGNMGGAVAKAVSKATTDIKLSDRSGKGKILAEELGAVYSTNSDIAATCQRVFLGVKPYFMKDVLEKIRPELADNKPLLITMAGGVEIKQIEDYVGFRLPVIRIMPNTPTAIGKGVIQYCANDLVSPSDLSSWLEDLRFCGMLDRLDEWQIDAASALSGSGPAYMYVFLEALADGAVTCGIPREKAYEYAAMTMIGSAEMYLATKQHPGALKDAVCSPMGSTICGLRAMEEHSFRAAAMDCVIATYNRNKEMGK